MNFRPSRIIITGIAGFIGSALAARLLREGKKIFGVDNLNNYYCQTLKNSRLLLLERIAKESNGELKFFKCSLENKKEFFKIVKESKPDLFIHLAAQAGVRYSIENPDIYFQSNLTGFCNVLEILREIKIKNFIFASSSSVYGGNTSIPFNEYQKVDNPVSLYAATKKSNEILAYSYSHLYKIPTTGLRFFTVYGPWGRPDMAPMLFTKAILEGNPIKVFNNGLMSRDFTFIDDVVEVFIRLLEKPPLCNEKFDKLKPLPDTSWAPCKIFNIGNNVPVNLLDFIKTLEEEIGIEAIKIMKPLEPGDVKSTFAGINSIEKWVNYKPKTDLRKGIKQFVNWYKNYYRISNN